MRDWAFVADMSRDGAITISDVWLWVKWVFFYPGDVLVYLFMSETPRISQFLELSRFSYGSNGSGVISAFAWLILLGAVLNMSGGIPSAPTPEPEPKDPKHFLLREQPWWVALPTIALLLGVLAWLVT